MAREQTTRKDLTVLVVGAGGSCGRGLNPANGGGFPLGERLNQLLPSCIDRAAVLQGSGVNPSQFNRQFIRSGQSSIDAFLASKEHDPRLVRLAKCGLSLALLDHEWGALRDAFGGWHAATFRAIHTSGAGRALSPHSLRIITFNYDRIIEYMLATMAVNSWGVEPSEAVGWSEEFVHHVYGELPGDYRWNSAGAHFELCANGQNYSGWHERASESIHVIGERAKFERIDWLERAKTVVFLGFGFDSQNLEVLGMPPPTNTSRKGTRWWDNANLLATGYKIEERRREQHRARMGVPSDKLIWAPPEHTCDRFFEQFFTPVVTPMASW